METADLKMEKAVQHAIVFGQFIAKEATGGGADACDVLCAAAARVFKAKIKQEHPDLTDDQAAQEFADFMKEVLDLA
jgi:hypothetical protein